MMADDKQDAFEYNERSPFLHRGDENLLPPPLLPSAVELQETQPTLQGGHQLQYRDTISAMTVVPTAPSDSWMQEDNQAPVMYYPSVLTNHQTNAGSSTYIICYSADQLDPRYFTGRQEEGDPEKANMVASGIAGAVVGSLVLGPFLGSIIGFWSAYATQKSGAAGDIARAMGEIALITREKARKIDHDHHIVDKSKIVLANAWERAKELDRQHHILERVKAFVIFSWRETVDFTRRHRLLERGVEQVGQGFEWFFKRLCGESEGRAQEHRNVPLAISPVKPY